MTPRPLRSFGILALSVGSFSTLQSLVVPVLPVIQEDLDTSAAAVTWTLTAWLIVAAVATPLLGRVGDMVGKRRIFLLALGAVAVGSLLAAIAPNIGVLIAARIVQGLGGALFPLAFGMLRDLVPPARLASGIGALSGLIAVGGGVGTVLAGPIAEVVGWRGLFLAPLVLVALGALLTWRYLPESPSKAGGRINVGAAVLLSSWLVALLLPLSTGAERGWTSAPVLGLFAVAAMLFVAWVAVELRSANPLVDMRMMALPSVWPTNVAAVLIGASMFGVWAYFPRFVQTPAEAGYGFGATVAASGLLMLPMLATMAVAGVLTGPLQRILGSRAQIAVGAGLIAVSAAGMGLLNSAPWLVAVEGAVFGLGLGVAYAAMTGVIVNSVPATQTGIASGVNANLRTIGSALGTALLTALITGTIVPATGLPTEGGYAAGFLTAAALAAGAALVVVAAAPLTRRAARAAGQLRGATASVPVQTASVPVLATTLAREPVGTAA